MVCKKYCLGIFSVSLGNQTMNFIQVFPEHIYAGKYQCSWVINKEAINNEGK
jgi:hypothetical protein